MVIQVASELAHKYEEGNHIVPPNRQVVAKGQRRRLGRNSGGYRSSWRNRRDSGSSGSGRDGVVGRKRGSGRNRDQPDLRLLPGDPDPILQPDQRLTPAVTLWSQHVGHIWIFQQEPGIKSG